MEIFRTYDIRGQYGVDLDDKTMYKIARTLVRMFDAKNAVVGSDISLASPKIHDAMIDGLLDQGADVIDIGLAGTDVVYFAAGRYGFDLGLEITASHAAGYLSGVKIIGPKATPFGMGAGMEKLKEKYLNYSEVKPDSKGELTYRFVWEDFIAQVLSFVHVEKIKPLKVVIDSSNAVGALEIDSLREHIPQVEIVKLNWKLDGDYPGHQPNPFLKENRQQLVARVREVKADLGVAFDGDADRIYFVDENGDFIFGVYVSALLAEKMCKEEPKRVVLHDVRAWRYIQKRIKLLVEKMCKEEPKRVVLHDVRAWRYIQKRIKEAGGIPKREITGHTFFKRRMLEEDGLFGAEATGHIYYNFGKYSVENSLIAFVQVLEIISESGKSLGELTREGRRDYPVSGEYNFSLPGFSATDDLTPEAIEVMNEILDRVRDKYSDGDVSDFDTLTVTYSDWNFNIRPSANDPLIRFNAEALDRELLKEKQEEVMEFLKAQDCKYVNDTGVTQIED